MCSCLWGGLHVGDVSCVESWRLKLVTVESIVDDDDDDDDDDELNEYVCDDIVLSEVLHAAKIT